MKNRKAIWIALFIAILSLSITLRAQIAAQLQTKITADLAILQSDINALIAVLTEVSIQPTPTPTPSDPTTLPLVQKANLINQYSFRLPHGPDYFSNFDYGGGAITYNQIHDSLLILNISLCRNGLPLDLSCNLVGEVSIPNSVPNATTLTALPTATMLLAPKDILEGKRLSVMCGANPCDASTGIVIGGLWPFNDQLAITAYGYYNASMDQTTSHFVRPLDLTNTGNVTRAFAMDGCSAVTVPHIDKCWMPGFYAGQFAAVPAVWQTLIGSDTLNWQCCIPIAARTSNGPDAWTIHPSEISHTYPKLTPLIWYPTNIYTANQDHPLGGYGTQNPYWNGSGGQTGLAWVDGTRSLLYFGTIGAGQYCYGPGTANQALGGTMSPDNVHLWCYDPENLSEGNHGYPYVYRVWAYDANDLVKAKNGAIQPWDVKPYAYWDINLPFNGQHAITSVGYKPSTRQIFVGQGFGDGSSPLINVLTVTGM